MSKAAKMDALFFFVFYKRVIYKMNKFFLPTDAMRQKFCQD